MMRHFIRLLLVCNLLIKSQSRKKSTEDGTFPHVNPLHAHRGQNISIQKFETIHNLCSYNILTPCLPICIEVGIPYYWFSKGGGGE